MSEPTTPQAVFFDLDGTLIDTAPDMGGALNRVLTKHNRPHVSPAQYRPHVSHGSIALLKLGVPELTDADHLHKLREEFLHEYATCVYAESDLFSGMDTVLQQLEHRRIPWGIITNKPETLTLSLLDQMALKHRCCCIVGADTAARAKPHPDPMLLACQRTGVTPNECIYVGDAERDIKAGRSVAMTTLVAGWGYIDPAVDEPGSWGADDLLSHPSELIPYLGSRSDNH